MDGKCVELYFCVLMVLISGNGKTGDFLVYLFPSVLELETTPSFKSLLRDHFLYMVTSLKHPISPLFPAPPLASSAI